MKYCIFNKASGEIVKTGTCPENELVGQLSLHDDSHGLLTGLSNGLEDQVVDQGGGDYRRVRRTDADIAQRRIDRQLNPPEVPHPDRPARITNREHNRILQRISDLEALVSP